MAVAACMLNRLVRIVSTGKVGRVASITDGIATVKVFYSVARQEDVEASVQDLAQFALEPGTRCYRLSNDNWIMGRTGTSQPDGQIEFKGSGSDGWLFVAPQDVYIRTPGAREDPLEVLIQCGNDTPYFSERRARLLAEFVQQRASCQGLTGVISSCIELYPHQLEAAARILSDPVQRYLLADEVGLGKTIEAGMVLRQILLDDPTSTALILVSAHLIDQWNEELEVKFKISDFPNRVRVQAHDDEVEQTSWTLLIIDEAHQVAAHAYSANESRLQRYKTLAALAKNTPKVLLLSATPLLDHEDDYLAMLHLLAPDDYQLDGIDVFRKRLQEREPIGLALLIITIDADEYPLSRGISRLCDLGPTDTRLRELCDGIGTLHNEDRAARIRAIRTHVSEVHRIYRRMIRHPKTVIGDFAEARIPPETQYATLAEFDIDELSANLNDTVETWRTEATAHCHDLPELSRRLASVYGSLIECLAGGSLAVLEFVSARLGQGSSVSLQCLLGDERLAEVRTAPSFDCEGELLHRMSGICNHSDTTAARSALAAQVAANLSRQRRASDLSGKVVVFCSFIPLAEALAKQLQSPTKQNVALVLGTKPRGVGAAAICQFRDEVDCDYLICDRTGEEGLNLQHASAVLLLDMPFSPRRIEQRLGRLDRIGQNSELRLKLLVGMEDGPTDAWGRALTDAFGLFHNSIASMQLAAEREAVRLLQLMFEHGPEALSAEDLVNGVRRALRDELDRIEEHGVLDTQDNHAHSDLVPALGARFEVDVASNSSAATEGWVCEALHGLRVPSQGEHFRYHFNSGQERMKSLLPQSIARQWSLCFEDEHTYSRRAANQSPFPKLMRIGNPFVDLLHRSLLEDDRGQVFAMWRHVTAWARTERTKWIGFRFDFLVEGDARVAAEALRKLGVDSCHTAAMRLLDGCYSPQLRTIYVHGTSDRPPDADVLRELDRPYTKHANGGTDVNLDGELRREFLECFEVGAWEESCNRARTRAEKLIRDSAWFKESVQSNLDRTRTRFNDNLAMLWARNQHATAGINLEAEQAFADSIVRAVECPTLTLDAVGFYILSGQRRGGRD